jgi:hypothetical protein
MIVWAATGMISCATTPTGENQPAATENSDPQTLDPMVDPEIMTDRPIEATTLEPDHPVKHSKTSKSKKKTNTKKKK